MYDAIELLLLIYLIFKRKAGLYFWSILLATFGLIPYSIGRLLVYFHITKNITGSVIDTIGWIMMVSGQSVVLYSRLHLVLQNPRILRAVLWMIIIDGVVLHGITTVISFGSHLSDARGFHIGYKVIEKVQMTIFCIQEFSISGLYVWKTVDILKTTLWENARTILHRLFGINVLIILMDVALLALEYRNVTVYQQSFKVVIYSVKLKLEFAVLNQLVEVVQWNNGSQLPSAAEGPDSVNFSRSGSDSPAQPTEKNRASLWSGKPEFTHSESPYTQEPAYTLEPTFSPIRTPAGDVEGPSEAEIGAGKNRSTISLDSENGDSEQMYMRAMRQITNPH